MHLPLSRTAGVGYTPPPPTSTATTATTADKGTQRWLLWEIGRAHV